MHIKVQKGSAVCFLVMSGLWSNHSIEPVEPVHQIELKRFETIRVSNTH